LYKCSTVEMNRIISMFTKILTRISQVHLIQLSPVHYSHIAC